ncbi:hypothetical protein E2C01_051477 [Portunus trituberculatus]|uniref:Ig-like domain-containing protein n=1 Tax=Portunus trituberculatus TaxID=210409 RepID=A0A5B7GJA8_PORTR|nr:hypothetical protein [Portunus trituberculatus]
MLSYSIRTEYRKALHDGQRVRTRNKGRASEASHPLKPAWFSTRRSLDEPRGGKDEAPRHFIPDRKDRVEVQGHSLPTPHPTLSNPSVFLAIRHLSRSLYKSPFCLTSLKLLLRLQVSWIRGRDLRILTVGRYTYTTDLRYEALHQDGTNQWTLRITSAQPRDQGTYECQISTKPVKAFTVFLKVLEPQGEILGFPDLYVQKASMINLTCILHDLPEPPEYVLWYHENKVRTSCLASSDKRQVAGRLRGPMELRSCSTY